MLYHSYPNVQMIKTNIQIILASTSARRKALLKSLGLRFTSKASGAEEKLGPPVHLLRGRPAGHAVSLARMKADDVADGERNPCCIIAADTIVVMGKRIIGKPSDTHDAEKILKLLSGKTHKVITGVCLLKLPEQVSFAFSVTTDVTMDRLTDSDIRWYVRTGEPMDKAGAYGIQGLGGIFIRRIRGSYTNVVGLPLPEVIAALKKLKAVGLE